MKRLSQKITIGRREFLDLPEFGLFALESKIDTGAYTSSLDCRIIREFHQNEKKMVEVRVISRGKSSESKTVKVFPVFKEKKVKSSNGVAEMRYIIKTKVRLGKDEFEMEFSLANRSKMEYPILIGRKALVKSYIVDVSKIHVLGKKESGTTG